MESQKHALLLVGSIRKPHSTSDSLGSYLLDKLNEYNFETELLLIHNSLKSDESIIKLLSATDRTDLLVIAFPLYVDSLPYKVTQTLEFIAQHRKSKNSKKNQRLTIVVNCGFPEAQHNNTALAICRQFAKEAGFIWEGGLSLGAGASINGRKLSEVQGMARNVIKSLDMAAEVLADGKSVPREAIELMAKPIIPIRAYTLMGGFGWKQQAKKYGADKKLRDRPYII